MTTILSDSKRARRWTRASQRTRQRLCMQRQRLNAAHTRPLAQLPPFPQSPRARNTARRKRHASLLYTQATQSNAVAEKVHASTRRRTHAGQLFTECTDARATRLRADSSTTLTVRHSVRVSSFGLFSLSAMSSFQISFTVLLRYLSTPYI
jgi:hypothetical protein